MTTLHLLFIIFMVCKDKARSFWVRYINERVLASFADHMSTITSTQAEPVAATEAEGMHAVAQTSNAILARLKEVEITNTGMVSVMDKLKAEISARDDKIRELSADKRKVRTVHLNMTKHNHMFLMGKWGL